MITTAKLLSDEDQAQQAAQASERVMKEARAALKEAERLHAIAMQRVITLRQIAEGRAREAARKEAALQWQQRFEEAAKDKSDPLSKRIRDIQANKAESLEKFPNSDASRFDQEIAELTQKYHLRKTMAHA